MSAITLHPEHYRAKGRDWPDEIADGGYFEGTSTIDPEEVVRAWDVLSTDTRVVELVNLPALLHRAVMAALRKRADK